MTTHVGAELIRRSQFFEAQQVADRVRALPPAIRDEALPEFVRLGCLDSFLIGSRGLIEFLAKKGSATRDFWAGDLVSTWSSADIPEPKVLEDAWLLASRHVAHFSKFRPMQPDGSWTVVTADSPRIDSIARAVLNAWDRFVTAWDADQAV